MAYSSLLSFSVCFLVLFHGCFGQIDMVTNRDQSQQSQQHQHNQCQLQNLNALQPKHRFKSEAGVTEFWDQNEEEFQCAGVAFLRHTIQHKGLLLPSFNNAPQLIYVVEGQGIQSAIFPGCPETYQSLSQRSQHRKDKQESPRDQHQKLRRIKAGDVVALPTGVAHWIYNNGPSQLVLVSLVDVGNNANQLDQHFRKFFLAGNPQEGLVTGGLRQNRDRSQSQRSEEQREGGNILSGFDSKLLAEVFRIDNKLARKLQNENDNRGAIVKMELGLTIPEETEEEQRRQRSEEEEEEEQRQQGSEEEEEDEEDEEQEEEKREEGSEEERERRPRREGRERRGSRRPREQGRQGRKGENGLEETLCSVSLRHSTDSSYADVFNLRAGRITAINSYKFPILQVLQLSAERGVLYKNAIYAPHWNVNAHSIVYITRGSGRIQVVAENGDAVFDDEVKQGQVIVVPQNFAVAKKAGNQGLEWIAFKTKANAKVSQIAGRFSVFRGMPADVIANSFEISREEAMKLKQSKQVSVVRPRQRSEQ